jgi:DNA mismatch endonuclease (patch repair protein)
MAVEEVKPAPATEDVRRRMSSQRRADTVPELALRSELHRRGRRFRIGIKVPGNARRTIDIAFPRQRLAIFVDGCFWHRCPVHSIPAKNNSAWWANKLAANVARDEQTTALLSAQGWRVVRVWEHEDPVDAATRIEQLLRTD